ncbi:MAG TPA: O-antigen polymerase [Pyrinomonadaceae bacterium]|nr:O-antigen polymerase [Pyrinomonadaceae bacterium]
MRYPGMGIAAVTVATVAAVNLIPTHPEPEGALFWPALVLTLGLLIAPAAAAFRQPKALLRAEHLLVMAPIYWLLLDLLQGAYSMAGVTVSEIEYAFIAIGIFVACLWLGSMGRPWRMPSFIRDSVADDLQPTVYFYLVIVSFLLGIAKFAVATDFNLIAMFRSLGSGRWDAPWVRGQLGGWDSFLDHLQYFGYLTSVLTVVVGRRMGWRNWRTIVSAVLSLVMGMFLVQSGSRRVIGVVVGVALVFWILVQDSKLKVKHAVAAMATMVALLLAMQVMLQYRNVGLTAALSDPAVAAEDTPANEYLHVDDNFYRLCQVIQLIPNTHPYVYHGFLVYAVVRPIPRVIWPDKPVDAGFDLTRAVGDREVSYSCSVIGELYMSLGFFGIAIGGWLYGRFAALINGVLTQSAGLGVVVIYSIGVMALFSGMRSLLELVLVSYVIVAWVVLARLFRTQLQ